MAPDPPRQCIYLMRHGTITSASEPKRFIGQTDLPLNAAGRKQARQWSALLAPTAFDGIYCSDLKRARETAGIIAAGRAVPVTALTALREIHLGAWEGLTFGEVRARFPDEFRRRGTNLPGYRLADGESFNDLRHRVVPAFEAIARQHGGHVLIVGHAGVNRVLLCHLLGVPLANLFRLAQDDACLNVLVGRGTGFQVTTLNHPPETFRS